MRGEIFNEFMEFAAETGSEDAARLRARRGASVDREVTRHYALEELVELVDGLAEVRGESRGAILRAFGQHLFGYFAALYPIFVDEADSAFALLADIDAHVHGELRKLYPDASFPTFACRLEGDVLEMTYLSERPLADLADGLIRGCVAHFADAVDVERDDLPGEPGTHARFRLLRRA